MESKIAPELVQSPGQGNSCAKVERDEGARTVPLKPQFAA